MTGVAAGTTLRLKYNRTNKKTHCVLSETSQATEPSVSGLKRLLFLFVVELFTFFASKARSESSHSFPKTITKKLFAERKFCVICLKKCSIARGNVSKIDRFPREISTFCPSNQNVRPTTPAPPPRRRGVAFLCNNR